MIAIMMACSAGENMGFTIRMQPAARAAEHLPAASYRHSHLICRTDDLIDATLSKQMLALMEIKRLEVKAGRVGMSASICAAVQLTNWNAHVHLLI